MSEATSAHKSNKVTQQTPASITQAGLPVTEVRPAVPAARGVSGTQDAEVVERERGNEEFKNGNFNVAVKVYTKCLGMKVCNNVLVPALISCPNSGKEFYCIFQQSHGLYKTEGIHKGRGIYETNTCKKLSAINRVSFSLTVTVLWPFNLTT